MSLDLFADNAGRVYERTSEGRRRVGTIRRYGTRWRFLDIECDSDGRRYTTRRRAIDALARWIERR